MIPLFAVGNIRFTFTLDTLANMFVSAGAMAAAYVAPTSCTISNFELVYNMIDFPTPNGVLLVA